LGGVGMTRVCLIEDHFTKLGKVISKLNRGTLEKDGLQLHSGGK